MPSRWDKLGQKLERVKNPLRFDINASIRPWTVHPDLRPRSRRRRKAEKAERERKENHDQR